MEKEKQQDNPKMSRLTKSLFAAVFAAVGVTTCGCEYVDGYRTYPGSYYGDGYRSPIIPPLYYRDYPRYDYRYRGYRPHNPELRITIPFDKRDYHGRNIRPNIQRPQRNIRPNIQRPQGNYPTPRRNPSTYSRPERDKK